MVFLLFFFRGFDDVFFVLFSDRDFSDFFGIFVVAGGFKAVPVLFGDAGVEGDGAFVFSCVGADFFFGAFGGEFAGCSVVALGSGVVWCVVCVFVSGGVVVVGVFVEADVDGVGADVDLGVRG